MTRQGRGGHGEHLVVPIPELLADEWRGEREGPGRGIGRGHVPGILCRPCSQRDGVGACHEVRWREEAYPIMAHVNPSIFQSAFDRRLRERAARHEHIQRALRRVDGAPGRVRLRRRQEAAARQRLQADALDGPGGAGGTDRLQGAPGPRGTRGGVRHPGADDPGRGGVCPAGYSRHRPVLAAPRGVPRPDCASSSATSWAISPRALLPPAAGHGHRRDDSGRLIVPRPLFGLCAWNRGAEAAPTGGAAVRQGARGQRECPAQAGEWMRLRLGEVRARRDTPRWTRCCPTRRPARNAARTTRCSVLQGARLQPLAAACARGLLQDEDLPAGARATTRARRVCRTRTPIPSWRGTSGSWILPTWRRSPRTPSCCGRH